MDSQEGDSVTRFRPPRTSTKQSPESLSAEGRDFPAQRQPTPKASQSSASETGIAYWVRCPGKPMVFDARRRGGQVLRAVRCCRRLTAPADKHDACVSYVAAMMRDMKPSSAPSFCPVSQVLRQSRQPREAGTKLAFVAFAEHHRQRQVTPAASSPPARPPEGFTVLF